LTVVGRHASPVTRAKPPAVQGAHDFVTLKFAEHCKVGSTVRAVALKCEWPDLNLVTRGLGFTEPPSRLSFGAINSFDREAL
jgi:hypothetical protein